MSRNHNTATYLAMPPPGINTVSSSSPVPRPEQFDLIAETTRYFNRKISMGIDRQTKLSWSVEGTWESLPLLQLYKLCWNFSLPRAQISQGCS